MKRLILASLLLLVLLVGYWVWPFIGLRALAIAVQTHNVAALNDQVDFGYLRRYVTAQIIASYLRITGRENKAGPLRALAPAVGASIVDPWVSEVINPETLLELLRGETIRSELGEVSFKAWQLPNFSLNEAWSAWLYSE